MSPTAVRAEKKEQTHIKVGTAIIKHLSTSFYPNPNMIFDELMSNARDAMATTVQLAIKDNEIIIEDDGDGMSSEELAKFFYISYSSKPLEPVKKKGRLARDIIGKFGIGKLSMYQLCRSFEIISWKDGIESKATFDFEAFEKKTFIDDFSLQVSSSASSHKNGTKIILQELKQKVSAAKVKRHLILTMPLADDFKIMLSGPGLNGTAELRSEDVLAGNISKKFKINEFVEKVGLVTGTIYYKKTTTLKEFGVFIRVFGRLVNANDPHTVINFSSLTSAQQFDRRIYADLNANGLNEAMQTNRAGFIIDHPAYLSFVEWLKKKLNKYNKEVGEKWREERKDIEIEIVKDAVSLLTLERHSTRYPAIPENTTLESKPSKVKSETRKEKETGKIETKEQREHKQITKEKDFTIDIQPLGAEEPEATLNKKDQIIIVNSSHPLYLISRSQGGIWGVQYHSIRASMVLLALASSDKLEDFKKNYDTLAINSQDIIANMKKRLTNLK